MRAWVLHDVGDIRFEDVAVPVPQEREVCVRVKCAGICGSDVPRIYETGAHKMPLIPGHEFSGVVHTVWRWRVARLSWHACSCIS
jgi:L-iditol 2-dehydrogenase